MKKLIALSLFASLGLNHAFASCTDLIEAHQNFLAKTATAVGETGVGTATLGVLSSTAMPAAGIAAGIVATEDGGILNISSSTTLAAAGSVSTIPGLVFLTAGVATGYVASTTELSLSSQQKEYMQIMGLLNDMRYLISNADTDSVKKDEISTNYRIKQLTETVKTLSEKEVTQLQVAKILNKLDQAESFCQKNNDILELETTAIIAQKVANELK